MRKRQLQRNNHSRDSQERDKLFDEQLGQQSDSIQEQLKHLGKRSGKYRDLRKYGKDQNGFYNVYQHEDQSDTSIDSQDHRRMLFSQIGLAVAQNQQRNPKHKKYNHNKLLKKPPLKQQQKKYQPRLSSDSDNSLNLTQQFNEGFSDSSQSFQRNKSKQKQSKKQQSNQNFKRRSSQFQRQSRQQLKPQKSPIDNRSSIGEKSPRQFLNKDNQQSRRRSSFLKNKNKSPMNRNQIDNDRRKSISKQEIYQNRRRSENSNSNLNNQRRRHSISNNSNFNNQRRSSGSNNQRRNSGSNNQRRESLQNKTKKITNRQNRSQLQQGTETKKSPSSNQKQNQRNQKEVYKVLIKKAQKNYQSSQNPFKQKIQEKRNSGKVQIKKVNRDQENQQESQKLSKQKRQSSNNQNSNYDKRRFSDPTDRKSQSRQKTKQIQQDKSPTQQQDRQRERKVTKKMNQIKPPMQKIPQYDNQQDSLSRNFPNDISEIKPRKSKSKSKELRNQSEELLNLLQSSSQNDEDPDSLNNAVLNYGYQNSNRPFTQSQIIFRKDKNSKVQNLQASKYNRYSGSLKKQKNIPQIQEKQKTGRASQNNKSQQFQQDILTSSIKKSAQSYHQKLYRQQRQRQMQEKKLKQNNQGKGKRSYKKQNQRSKSIQQSSQQKQLKVDKLNKKVKVQNISKRNNIQKNENKNYKKNKNKQKNNHIHQSDSQENQQFSNWSRKFKQEDQFTTSYQQEQIQIDHQDDVERQYKIKKSVKEADKKIKKKKRPERVSPPQKYLRNKNQGNKNKNNQSNNNSDNQDNGQSFYETQNTHKQKEKTKSKSKSKSNKSKSKQKKSNQKKYKKSKPTSKPKLVQKGLKQGTQEKFKLQKKQLGLNNLKYSKQKQLLQGQNQSRYPPRTRTGPVQWWKGQQIAYRSNNQVRIKTHQLYKLIGFMRKTFQGKVDTQPTKNYQKKRKMTQIIRISAGQKMEFDGFGCQYKLLTIDLNVKRKRNPNRELIQIQDEEGKQSLEQKIEIEPDNGVFTILNKNKQTVQLIFELFKSEQQW